MSKANQLYADLMRAIQANHNDIPCRDNPAYWDDEGVGLDHETRRTQIGYAKLMCKECPVRNFCAEYAIAAKEPTGVWGALSTTDREKLLTSN